MGKRRKKNKKRTTLGIRWWALTRFPDQKNKHPFSFCFSSRIEHNPQSSPTHTSQKCENFHMLNESSKLYGDILTDMKLKDTPQQS